jgi:hypothetical protein
MILDDTTKETEVVHYTLLPKLEMQHNEKREKSMLILLGKSNGCKSVKRALLIAPTLIL